MSGMGVRGLRPEAGMFVMDGIEGGVVVVFFFLNGVGGNNVIDFFKYSIN